MSLKRAGSATSLRFASSDIDEERGTTDPPDMAPHLTLQAWWSATGVRVRTRKASSREIAALETRYGVSLPDDFRHYLEEGVPCEDNWDAEDGNWWPIERIRNIPDEYDHEVDEPVARNAANHLFFLDYSIWCCAWAISCAEDETRGKVAVIGGESDGYVADSFTEFVELYTTDCAALYGVSRAS